MKKIMRSLARRFFQNWIKVYTHDLYIPMTEVLLRDERSLEGKKVWIAEQFARKMIEDGLIEFEHRQDIDRGGVTIHSKIRVI